MSSKDNTNTLLKLLEKYRIEVPRLQRDYAQGRLDEHSQMVRTNLLNDIQQAFETKIAPLDLNFVYGKISGDTFYPVDGQQRLTTLFLIHIYAFYNDDEKTKLLHKFSYEARTTTRDFFSALVNKRFSVFNEIGKTTKLSENIADAAWFIDSWKYDPSVQSALTVLDAIVAQNFNLENLKKQLEERDNPKVIFQFPNLPDLAMEDDLYIKLNARGRALTPFENFKAKFIDRCEQICPNISEEIKENLDGKWADMFWNCSHQNSQTSEQSFDQLYLTIFEFTFYNYNLLVSEPNKEISNNWIYILNYGLITSEICYAIRNTLNYLSQNTESKANQLFSNILKSTALYPPRVLFHAISKYLADENTCEINEIEFFDWLRIINNLVSNTRIDESKDYRAAIDGINALAIYKKNIIEHLALGSVINLSGFSQDQFEEECQKARIMIKSEVHRETILDAEKKLSYFSGQIRCALFYSDFEQNNDCVAFNTYVDKIALLFDSDKPRNGILLRRALCSLGDYTILIGGRYKTLCIDSPDESSRAPSSLKRLFSDHGEIVHQLLSKIDLSQPAELQLNKIIEENIVSQLDWRYCLIHYPELFKWMSSSYMRLCEAERDMLLIPNKSSMGRNYSLYLGVLLLQLREHGIEVEYITDEGTNAERYLKKDDIKITFDRNCYKIFVKENLEWTSSSEAFIDETIYELCSRC